MKSFYIFILTVLIAGCNVDYKIIKETKTVKGIVISSACTHIEGRGQNKCTITFDHKKYYYFNIDSEQHPVINGMRISLNCYDNNHCNSVTYPLEDEYRDE